MRLFKTAVTITLAAVGLSACSGVGSNEPTPTITHTVPGPTKTLTQVKVKKVPGPTKTVKVPGPTRTVVVVSRSQKRTAPKVVSKSTTNHNPPGGIAACIRKYESGGNYQAQNPTSTASGAYQFLDSTWQAVTGLPGRAMNYSPAQQDAAFYKLWDNGRGANQWVTAHKCGY